ncbi:unnamed protein product [Rotaria sordida]|uniref:DUF4614 domain-containing protein n=1 Tax=Rotaria sordida TaxID=392033 RepID=A0A818MTE9_9BILA|nr:unnamed protein product [Rotaria sordida]
MPSSMSDLAARMNQRKQRLQEEQQNLDRKLNIYAQNPDGISEVSELESSQQPPKPKQRHHRSSTKSPFDDDSSLQFGYNDKKSHSTTTTTSSTTPRQPNKFVKKSTTIPTATTEKLSVTHSPRDVASPRVSARKTSDKKPQQSSSTGLLTQSALLARAQHRQQLYAKGIELEPGAFDEANDEDESSSDATTSGSKVLFGSGKKSFLKKTATTTPANQVPDLQHLDSETNSSEREGKKTKHNKNRRPSLVLDTEDDSLLDFGGDGSSSEGRKTPTLTPRKGILKSPKDFIPKESEHSVQFSERLVTVQTDEERIPTPIKTSRSTTPRRIQITKKPLNDVDEIISSETESISTAIDVDDDDDYTSIPFSEHISESPVNNMFANLLMNNEPLITSVVKKKSPRITTKKSPSTINKIHHKHETISEISDDENTKVEEVPEEQSIINYSEDFSLVTTETSTPRPSKPTNIYIEKQIPLNRTIQKVSTYDQQVQVDIMSTPFQSSLNQIHSIYLINENDLNEIRPSSLFRSVVEPQVLQSLLTTNPVLLAVDDLLREQSSLLRSFIQLQRTYYESTIRSIRPEYIYVTKDNTLRFIADHQQFQRHFQSNDDSITN